MDVLDVYCQENTDPQMIVIVLANTTSYEIPYTFYQLIQEPLGLPNIICGV